MYELYTNGVWVARVCLGGDWDWVCMGGLHRRRHNGQHLLIKSSQVARLSVLKSYYPLVFGLHEGHAASCCSALEHNVIEDG